MSEKTNGNGHVDAEKVNVEEEETVKSEGPTWSEEFQVAAEDVVDFVKNVVKEANVRRVMIKQGDRVVLDIPLWLTVGGIAWLPIYAALGVIVTLATNHSIVVERRESKEEKAAAA
jgi:hypothetical protein